ncbi:hypothetical protein DAEQUDRAFT_768520 [Daedalea quercina L-15889]|uniref:Nonribosomal peptide synthetase 12 n=1 Tax=Daedalea quercina L-15889 TaxID=1314783 RepID=A0A165MK72_9APHY|nr:hypothetical protein DAEQUDRAFT_768520 [Daedalea quercina L-15889]
MPQTTVPTSGAIVVAPQVSESHPSSDHASDSAPSVPSGPTLAYHGDSPDPEKGLAYGSSTSTLDEKVDIKKTEVWEGFGDDELPDKTQGRLLRNVRFQMLSLYRRLFGIVFFTNLGIFIWYCVKGANANQIATVLVGNLFASILMRQEYVINAFFTVACLAPKSWPLWIRRILARVYSIGGIHSGAGVSGTVWLILFVGKATREVIDKGKTSVATLVLAYVVLALLVAMVIAAYPTIRVRYHDHFEAVHRLAGWTAVALVWALVVLLINDYRAASETLGHAVVHSAPFWLVLVLTISIILPWARLRKVPVRAEVLSEHCVRLYFDYVNPHPGHFTRMSLRPLWEWHSFATIAEPGKKGYSAVVSRAGDWTKQQISNPPDKIWIRGIPCYGVVRVTPLFRRVVMVATGSGIGPIAPVVFAKKTEIQLLWTAPAVRKTFGDKLVDSLLEASPNSVIYDTRVHGRPDMVKLTYRMVREFNAEAVVIISNQPITQKVVYGMMSRGIPAFGAIWDS